MAIWLRAREEFADNRFQLLFIYMTLYSIAGDFCEKSQFCLKSKFSIWPLCMEGHI